MFLQALNVVASEVMVGDTCIPSLIVINTTINQLTVMFIGQGVDAKPLAASEGAQPTESKGFWRELRVVLTPQVRASRVQVPEATVDE